MKSRKKKTSRVVRRGERDGALPFDRRFFERFSELHRRYLAEMEVEQLAVKLITDAGDYIMLQVLECLEDTFVIAYYDDQLYEEPAVPLAILPYHQVRSVHFLPSEEDREIGFRLVQRSRPERPGGKPSTPRRS